MSFDTQKALTDLSSPHSLALQQIPFVVAKLASQEGKSWSYITSLIVLFSLGPVQNMRGPRVLSTVSLLLSVAASPAYNSQAIDTSWHAPTSTPLNNLTSVLNSRGVYGFIFNSSSTPDHAYGTYNWCNMPHIRPAEYVVADKSFELQYVELVCQEAFQPIG